jgi:hypothetical protein
MKEILKRIFCRHNYHLLKNHGVSSDFVCHKCGKAITRSLSDMYV